MARLRSPGYPSVSLEDALRQVEQIYAKNRTNAIDREAAAKSMGYSGSSGASDKMIANLSHYGLVEKVVKGEIRVSQLAVDVLRPEHDASRASALQTAAFHPRLFAMLQEQFPDGHVSETALRNVLARSGFQEKAIPSASKAFMNTCEFLKQEGAYESYDGAPTSDIKSPSDRTEPLEALGAVRYYPAPDGPQPKGMVKLMEGERVVFVEEGSPSQYLKLVASGELDEGLLEALEDYVKRQKKRIALVARYRDPDYIKQRREGMIRQAREEIEADEREHPEPAD